MDLRTIANQVSNTVNGNIPIVLQSSTGPSTSGVGQRRTPQFAAPVNLFGQIQALDSAELRHLDGLNIQGTIRAIYITGFLSGVDRPIQKGGDLINVANGPHVGQWLIVKVLETWPLWTKAVVVRQVNA